MSTVQAHWFSSSLPAETPVKMVTCFDPHRTQILFFFTSSVLRVK